MKRCKHRTNSGKGTFAIWEGEELCIDCVLDLPGIAAWNHPLFHIYVLEKAAHPERFMTTLADHAVKV